MNLNNSVNIFIVMDNLYYLNGDDSDSRSSSTDLDEYDTAEEFLDCNDSFVSFDDSLDGGLDNDDYPDINFIDEENNNVEVTGFLSEQQSTLKSFEHHGGFQEKLAFFEGRGTVATQNHEECLYSDYKGDQSVNNVSKAQPETNIKTMVREDGISAEIHNTAYMQKETKLTQGIGSFENLITEPVKQIEKSPDLTLTDFEDSYAGTVQLLNNEKAFEAQCDFHERLAFFERHGTEIAQKPEKDLNAIFIEGVQSTCDVLNTQLEINADTVSEYQSDKINYNNTAHIQNEENCTEGSKDVKESLEATRICPDLPSTTFDKDHGNYIHLLNDQKQLEIETGFQGKLAFFESCNTKLAKELEKLPSADDTENDKFRDVALENQSERNIKNKEVIREVNVDCKNELENTVPFQNVQAIEKLEIDISESVDKNEKCSVIKQTAFGKIHGSSEQFSDNQKSSDAPKDFKNKLAFFEGRWTDSRKKHKKNKSAGHTQVQSTSDVSNGHLENNMKIKAVVSEDDSSDETDVAAANETSYEELLESLLETDKLESVSRKSSTGSEELEDIVKTIQPCHVSVDHDNLAIDDDFKDTEYFIRKEGLEKGSVNGTPCGDSVNLIIPESEAQTKEGTSVNQYSKDEKHAEPTVRSVELGVTCLNKISHQKHLFCAKMVYAAAEARKGDVIKQETNDNSVNIKVTCTDYDASPCDNNRYQNAVCLLPVKNEIERSNASENMINRQSSVIKENHLTEMPFTGYADSEILGDINGSQQKIKSPTKEAEPTQEVAVRYVELGIASLLEGSHFKNLKCARIVNPFITKSDTQNVAVNAKGSVSESNSIHNNVANLDNIKDETCVNVSIQENIIPLIADGVLLPPNSFGKTNEVKESVETNENEYDDNSFDRKSKRKSGDFRKRVSRRNAIVSDYSKNIEKLGNLKYSEVTTKTDSFEELSDNKKQEVATVEISTPKREVAKDSATGPLVRTVEIGTAYLYEIPHLKYLHCAKIVSRSS